jgi:dipeptidyl aminopeptidase/acylaminoacyl peptidase
MRAMKNIKLDQFLDFHFLGQVKTSPNHKKAAFIETMANEEENEYQHTLHILEDNKTDKIRFLKGNSDYIFLNDDLLLLDYQKNQEERDDLKERQKKSFYTYDLHRKKLSKAFTLPINGKIEDFISETKLLISSELTVEDHILYEGVEADRKVYLEKVKKQNLYENIDQIPYYFNGQGFVQGKKKQLFIYDTESKSLTRLLDKSFSVGVFKLLKDKGSIVYSGKYAEKVMTHTSKIYKLDFSDYKQKVLYNKLDYNIVNIIEKDDLIVFAKDMVDFGLNQNPSIYKLKEDKLEQIHYYGHSYGNSIGTDCRILSSQNDEVFNGNYYFTSTIDDHSRIYTLTNQNDLLEYYDFDGSIDGLFFLQGKMYLVAMHKQKLQEIYQLTHDFKLIQITDFNDSVFKKYYVAEPEVLEYEDESHTVKGFVLLPEGYNPNKKYPMILDIHGGPKTVYGQIYYHEMQYWVNQGYIVAFANPRGSDGKGNEFADIRGKYGSIDYDDLMNFTDLVIQKYKGIDINQLYVTGGSYGGFMTNWIVSHTNRFKAAVTQRSISNWLSFYGTSDIGYYFATDQTAGHPIMDLDLLYKQSPIKYAMQIETPLMFIHSDKDYRCPMEQAQQLYAILKTNGVDTHLVWFRDETHELSRSGKPQARIKRLKDITCWFKKY